MNLFLLMKSSGDTSKALGSSVIWPPVIRIGLSLSSRRDLAILFIVYISFIST